MARSSGCCRLAAAIALALTLASMAPVARACSEVLLANRTIYAETVSARTLDMPPDPKLRWDVVAVRKGTPLTLHSLSGYCAPQTAPPADYSFVCLSASRDAVNGFASSTCSALKADVSSKYAGMCLDGLNDGGLSVAALVDTTENPVSTPLPDTDKESLYEYDLGTYLLARFKTVAAVKAWLTPKRVQLLRGGLVRDAVVKQGTKVTDYSYQWTVSDRSGESIVIEVRKKSFSIVNNELGVMAQGPGVQAMAAAYKAQKKARVEELGAAMAGLMTPGFCEVAQAKFAPKSCNSFARFATLAGNKEALYRKWASSGSAPASAASNSAPGFGALASAMRFIEAAALPGAWPAGQKIVPENSQTLFTTLRDHSTEGGAYYFKTAASPRWVEFKLADLFYGPSSKAARAPSEAGVAAKPLDNVAAPASWAVDGASALVA